MGTKSSSQALSIASILIAALFSMSIAYQLTVHARSQLLSQEAEKTATQVVRQLERELGGIGKIFDPSQEARLDQVLKDKKFAPNLFSYVVSDLRQICFHMLSPTQTMKRFMRPVTTRQDQRDRRSRIQFGKRLLPVAEKSTLN
jgi:hypothetical protein